MDKEIKRLSDSIDHYMREVKYSRARMREAKAGLFIVPAVWLACVYTLMPLPFIAELKAAMAFVATLGAIALVTNCYSLYKYWRRRVLHGKMRLKGYAFRLENYLRQGV